MRFSLSTAIFPLAVLAAAVPKPVVKSNGITIKLSKQAPFPNSHNTVDLDALKAHVASHNAKVLRGFDNYEKNMGKPHPYAAVNGNGMRERGDSIPLTAKTEQVWLGEISIGTPPKTLTVEIGTGTSDLFVLSTHCGTCVGDTQALWNPDGSSTSRFRTVVDGKPMEFNEKYVDSSTFSGILYVDTVTISSFTADEQTFGAVSTYSMMDPSNQWAPHGQLGLAFQSISAFPIASKPLLATLVYDEVTEPVFSIMLAFDGGELYIGGVNPDLYRGEFTYAYVTVVGHWQVNIQSIQDDKGKVAKLQSTYWKNIPAVIDTGCNYIVGDENRVSTIHTALGGIRVGTGGFYAYPCDSFPAISFTFDGRSFKIPPTHLKLGRISQGSDKCFSAIVGLDLHESTAVWTIGNAFLQGYYTTFDFGDNPRVGFAELK